MPDTDSSLIDIGVAIVSPRSLGGLAGCLLAAKSGSSAIHESSELRCGHIAKSSPPNSWARQGRIRKANSRSQKQAAIAIYQSERNDRSGGAAPNCSRIPAESSRFNPPLADHGVLSSIKSSIDAQSDGMSHPLRVNRSFDTGFPFVSVIL